MSLPVSPQLPPDLQEPLDALRRDGPRRFARWDADLFDAFAAGPLHVLAETLRGQADAGAVLAAYAGLLHQGVGINALRRTKAGPDGWSNYLERCLIEQVPTLLPRAASVKRLALLVKAWNLGEGLLREPVWLDRYVTASAATLESMDNLESFLVRTLEPVLSTMPPASWKGPFTVTVLDLRPLHEEFLPGEITLAAPAILRIADRRRKGTEIAVLLGRGGQSKPLGLMTGLGEFAEAGDRPAIDFQDGRVRIADQDIVLPWLRRCHRHVIARSGFLAACAIDSQRLWILESP